MENHVHFDWKISHFERKIIYALILPSNNFRKPHLKRESSSTLFTRSKTHLQAYLNQAPASPTQPSFDQPRSCCPTIQNPSPSIPLNHFQRKKGTEPRERERGQSLELEIDSTAVWAVPLTTNLPYFSLPPSATHVIDLPFSLYACRANHRKTSDPS